MLYSAPCWGCSSAGRTLDWQSRGHGFEPRRLHLASALSPLQNQIPVNRRERVVAAGSLDEAFRLGRALIQRLPEAEGYESEASLAIENHYSSRGFISKAFRCALVDHFSDSMEQYLKIAWPFSPDIIVYCKSNYLFIGEHLEAELVQAACEQFEETHGYYPKVIIEEKGGLIVIEENERSVKNVQEVYLDQMKISMLSENFGGPHFMSPEQIRFIDNWEVEHYRRKIAKKG